MSDGSLRRRFVIVTAGLCALILAFAVVLGFLASSQLVADHIEARLVERGRSAAAAFDAKLDQVGVTISSLAAIMDKRNLSPVGALWQGASTIMNNADGLISRIGVIRPYRDSFQVVMFRRAPVADGLAPMSTLILPELSTELQSLYAERWSSSVEWQGPTRGYRQPGRQEVIIGTLGYRGANEQPLGVIWVEIPLTALDEVLANNAASMNEARELGAVLLGENSATLAHYNGIGGNRQRSVDLTDEELAEIAALQVDNVVEMNTAAFGSSATFYASEAPLNSGNGWRLLRFVPLQSMQSATGQSALVALVVGLIGVTLVIWAIRWLTGANLTTPLNDLTQAAQEIGSGDMRYQIAYQERPDELGRLARALESMKRDLAQSYDTMQTWSRTLEKRVAERTLALENAEKQAQNVARDLRAVYDTSLAVANEYYFEIVLKKLTEQVPKLLEARYCGVWLLEDHERELRLVATTSAHKEFVGRTMSIEEGLAGEAVRTRRPVIVDDYPLWTGRTTFHNDDPDVFRALAVPLMVANMPIGAVLAARPADTSGFTEGDERMLTLLATLAAPVVRNAQLIAQLDEAVKLAEGANQVKTRFLATVTHELRTPLNLVINNMDFMRVGMFGEVNDEQREKLDQTIRSAEHLLYLINDLLDVSKIEAGEMQLFFQPTELYPVIEDALDATIAQIGTQSQVVLQVDMPEKLPIVEMDARRIRQVLLNLLSNAVKFTKEGEVRLKITPNDNEVEFTVSDTGIGIAPEDLNGIFEAFERTRRVRDMAIEGTGLGLAISRYLVNAHGGKLTVQSTVGVGSTFTFVLPLRQPDPDLTRPGRIAVAEGSD